MFYCARLADLNLRCKVKFDNLLRKTYEGFYFEFEDADIDIEVTSNDIERERLLDREPHLKKSNGYLEAIAAFRLFAEQLPKFDAAVLHSCAFKVEEKGIAFGACSGTGKTTHMLLWRDMLGDKFEIVNGDKPLIRFIDEELYIYGSPWAGKERLRNNIRVPLTDICKIERSETNETLPLSKEEAIELLMQQIYMPFDPVMRMKTIALVYRIAEKVNFWKIKCNMDIEAAEVSYNAIFGDKK